ncbi:AAA family ATPase [Pseudidiomarina terrestris]|uniref:AAA family ATPase n=1 Tax=Pseudidiomarina terrestris TaxID=2820060 RepID=UPI00265164F0|nr:SMC family ATPase [Pseudidiomarina sp. 1ASP75-5]MDN7135354.1 SMC family ATPase [Pseudidiomarina sp. 1ASP75-5]
MKPLYLAMTAFGPFANTETVNFNDLGEHPLFLINGPTGAGKTTLLDAMNFALYGTSTGDRSGPSMRCHHASDELVTEVVFIFALGSAIYRVERKPFQFTAKKRGEGLAKREHTANIYKVSSGEGKPEEWSTELLEANSVRDVTDLVSNLIGLDEKQFKQVVVLPQGRFRELLTANSENREKILASLFNTAEFKRIEEAVRERAQRVSSDYQALKKQLEHQLKEAGFQSIEQATLGLEEQEKPIQETLSELETLRSSREQAQKALTQAEELVKRFVSLEANKQKLETLNQQAEAIAVTEKKLEKHDAAQRIQPQWSDFCRNKKEADERGKALLAADKELQQATSEQKAATEQLQLLADTPMQIEQLKSQVNHFTEQLKSLQAISEVVQQLKFKEKERDTAAARNTELATELQQTRDTLTETKAKLTKLNAAVQSHANIEAKQSQLETQHARLQQRDALQQRVKTETNALTEAKKPLPSALKSLEKAHTASQELRLRWHREQAIALAHELTPGEPCPVCGSNEHPNPANAQQEGELVSQEQLDTAEANVKQCDAAVSKVNLRVNQAETKLAATQEQLKAQQQELGELAEVATDKVKQQLTDLVVVAEQQREEKQNVADLNKSLDELVNKETQQQQQLQKLIAELHQAESTVAQLDARLDTIDPEKRLRALTAEAVEAQRTETQAKAVQLQQGHEQAQKTKSSADTKLAAAKSTQTATAKELETARQGLTDAEQAWQAKLTSSKFIDAEAYLAALLEADQEQRLKTEITEHRQQLTETKAAIAHEQKAIGEQAKPDVEALQTKYSELKQNEASVEHILQSLRSKHEQLRNMITSYEQRVAQSEQLVHEYRVVGALADTLSGENEMRISLQRFVLAILLDDVLHEASIRLEQMSNGRYRLVRRETAGDRRKHGGLDLMIDDTHTGQDRDVNTLSGGESFMAALALALGLSDVVQSYSGGIRIDTLFIDEGFGSLDSEALDLAIDVLANLRASGRTIGIISHVNELKLRIHKRIDVKRGVGGSRLRVG